jgi:hypothetical protein
VIIVVCTRLLRQLIILHDLLQVPTPARNDCVIDLGQLGWSGSCRKLCGHIVSGVRKHRHVGTRLPIHMIRYGFCNSSHFAGTLLGDGIFDS